jgi:hypothetical protein
MKKISAFAIVSGVLALGLQFSGPAAAGEQIASPAAAPAAKESAATDCSKEVWPDFSNACLSNARAVEVRKVNVNRRY